MDLDFWGSRVHSSKHPQAAHLSSDNHLVLDDPEEDEYARACFPCPLCDVDIELSVLSSHLQDEHCFEVCPVCAANLGKDVVGHFTLQHSHSLKRRRKSHRSGFWINDSPILCKELREPSSFLKSTSLTDRGDSNVSPPDPLLAPFLWNIPCPDNGEGHQRDTCSTKDCSTTCAVKSAKPSTRDEGKEQDYEEGTQRAAFFQQLLMSTIF